MRQQLHVTLQLISPSCARTRLLLLLCVIAVAANLTHIITVICLFDCLYQCLYFYWLTAI